MKNVKKNRKKKGDRHNIQNIEGFEVLDNSPNIEGMENQGEEKDEKKKRKKKMQEQGIGTNDRDFWEGLPDDEEEADDFGGGFASNLTKMINNIYVAIITMNCLIALTFATGKPHGTKYVDEHPDVINVNLNNAKFGKSVNENPINSGDPDLTQDNVNDANTIFRRICSFEALISAYLFTFSWYYLIFYCYSENISTGNIFDGITRDKLSNSTNPFGGFLFFIFEYAIVILDYVRWTTNVFLPKYVGKIISKPLCYVLLFIIIYNFNYTFLSFYKGILIDTISRNMHTNVFIILFYFIVIGEYIRTYNPYSKMKDANSDDPLAKMSLLIDLTTSLMTNNIVTLFFKFLKEILRLIIIFVVAVPAGTFLCVLYFLWVSLVTGTSKLIDMKSLDAVTNFVRSDLKYSGNDPCDVPRSWWEKIWFNVTNILLIISMGIYSNLLYMSIIMFSIVTMMASTYINDNKAKTALVITFAVILGLAVLLWLNTIRTYSKTNLNGLWGLFVSPEANQFIKFFEYSMYFCLFFIVFIAVWIAAIALPSAIK